MPLACIRAILLALAVNASLHAATITRLDDDATQALNTNTSIAIGSDGLPRVAWGDAGDDSFRFAICTALDCSEFTFETVAGAIGTSASMVLDAGDGMQLAYYDAAARALAFDDGSLRMIDISASR